MFLSSVHPCTTPSPRTAKKPGSCCCWPGPHSLYLPSTVLHCTVLHCTVHREVQVHSWVPGAEEAGGGGRLRGQPVRPRDHGPQRLQALHHRAGPRRAHHREQHRLTSVELEYKSTNFLFMWSLTVAISLLRVGIIIWLQHLNISITIIKKNGIMLNPGHSVPSWNFRP